MVGFFKSFKEGFETPKTGKQIKVLGIGGDGCHFINAMVKEKITEVDYIACDVDGQNLATCNATTKIGLGDDKGEDIQQVIKFIKEASEEIKKSLEGAEFVFITAGLGSAIGTEGAFVVEKICRELGIVSVVFATTPFHNEGADCLKRAEEAIELFKKEANAINIINNQQLLDIYPDFNQASEKSNDLLATNVKSLVEIITSNLVQIIDFYDIKNTLENSGVVFINSFSASGENRKEEVVKGLIHTPLFADGIKGATKLLLTIKVKNEDSDITSEEYNYIAEKVSSEASDQVELILGYGFDSNVEEGEIKLNLVATGFPKNQ